MSRPNGRTPCAYLPNDEYVRLGGCDDSWLCNLHVPVGSSKDATQMRDLQQDFVIHQLVDTPTRELHILDLLLTNSVNSSSNVEVIDGIPGSDHDAVRFSIRKNKQPLSRYKRHSYNFKKANFDHFRDLLSRIPWSFCFLNTNVEDAWVNLRTFLLLLQTNPSPLLSSNPEKG